MLTYWNDPRFRNERIMLIIAIPIALVILGFIGYLAVKQIRTQNEEFARLSASASKEPPVAKRASFSFDGSELRPSPTPSP